MSDALRETVTRYTNAQPGTSPFVTTVPGLTLLRSHEEKMPSHLIFKPALCLVVQGAKWTMFGDTRFDYRAGQALVVSVEMPAFSRIAQASPSEPYLGVIIQFDLAIMREVLEALNTPLKTSAELGMGVFVRDFDGPLADCALRMVRLIGEPDAIPILAPSIMREICYRLLTGPNGAEVARIALGNGHAQDIIRAIHELRGRFAETVRIEDLALTAQMSPSAFHRQFKTLTSMTPLQYQKQMRLLEARRLMVIDAANVDTASYQVGYESPSQFSREYARMFGAPPRRDITRLRSLSEDWDRPFAG